MASNNTNPIDQEMRITQLLAEVAFIHAEINTYFARRRELLALYQQALHNMASLTSSRAILLYGKIRVIDSDIILLLFKALNKFVEIQHIRQKQELELAGMTKGMRRKILRQRKYTSFEKESLNNSQSIAMLKELFTTYFQKFA